MSWWKKEKIKRSRCSKCDQLIYGLYIVWGNVEGKPIFCEPCIVEAIAGVRREYRPEVIDERN